MTSAGWRRRALGLVAIATAVLAALFFFEPPVAQNPAYFQFADQRELFGIANSLDVLSNLGFLMVGMLGLAWVIRHPPGADRSYLSAWERFVNGLFFSGVLATALGSAWFHHHPDIHSLVWDRLPMTVSFMALLALIIAERMGLKTARILLPFLVLFGSGSVFWWAWGEAHGHGDLRPYVFVQFFPLLAILLLLALFPPRYTRTRDLIGMIGWYALAKLFEFYDAQIFALGHWVSGHTLKHLAAATATYWIYRQMKLRRPLQTA